MNDNKTANIVYSHLYFLSKMRYTCTFAHVIGNKNRPKHSR